MSDRDDFNAHARMSQEGQATQMAQVAAHLAKQHKDSYIGRLESDAEAVRKPTLSAVVSMLGTRAETLRAELAENAAYKELVVIEAMLAQVSP